MAGRVQGTATASGAGDAKSCICWSIVAYAATAMPVTAGQSLNQRYRIVKALSPGPNARLWVADHLALSSQVAVKLLDQQIGDDEAARERFRKEATAAARLKSPHVVQVLD